MHPLPLPVLLATLCLLLPPAAVHAEEVINLIEHADPGRLDRSFIDFDGSTITWRAGEVAEGKLNSFSLSFIEPLNLASHTALRITLHSSVLDPGSINIALQTFSHDPQFEGAWHSSGYLHLLPVDWEGEKTVVIPLESFTDYNSPIGREEVYAISIGSAGWAARIAPPETVLILTKIEIVK